VAPCPIAANGKHGDCHLPYPGRKKNVVIAREDTLLLQALGSESCDFLTFADWEFSEKVEKYFHFFAKSLWTHS